MKKSFKTVHKHSEIEIIEKKSRFIANVLPVCNEQEALDFISDIKNYHSN